MEFVLENQFVTVKINSLGAELKSVFDRKKNLEILYNGKSEFWNRSAPILFPIVGRLKNDEYQFNYLKYNMKQHGFARDREFTCISNSEQEITFQLKYDEISLKIYPFKFELFVIYSLQEQEVFTTYKVRNIDSKEFLFSVGAHPGFTFPTDNNLNFKDYYLEFEEKENLDRHLLNLENGLFNSKTENILNNSNKLALNYSFFEKDAIVFKRMKSTWIKIKCSKSKYCLKFSFKNFPFFGIWTKASAPFLCLEPWHGLADSEFITGEIKEKEGIRNLQIGQTFECSYSFGLDF